MVPGETVADQYNALVAEAGMCSLGVIKGSPIMAFHDQITRSDARPTVLHSIIAAAALLHQLSSMVLRWCCVAKALVLKCVEEK